MRGAISDNQNSRKECRLVWPCWLPLNSNIKIFFRCIGWLLFLKPFNTKVSYWSSNRWIMIFTWGVVSMLPKRLLQASCFMHLSSTDGYPASMLYWCLPLGKCWLTITTDSAAESASLLAIALAKSKVFGLKANCWVYVLMDFIYNSLIIENRL